MRYCKHTQWLGLAVNDGDVLLQHTDRLQTLLEDLPDPGEQSPSLFVFIGNRSKAMAIKELAKTFSPPPRYGRDSSRQSRYEEESRGQTKLNGRRAHGEIHLHIHAPSTFSSRPVLLAEGDFPTLDKTKPLAMEKCHETESRALNARTLTAPTLSASADKIYCRLLSPFTDVFCFFADDVGKLKPIVQRLALWLDLGQSSSLPKSTRPKVLIVMEREDVQGDDESVSTAFKRMLCEETTMDVSDQFSDIRILSLPARSKNLSNKSRHRELFEHLLNFSDQVREAKVRTQTLFSACHFAAFFRYALNHLVATSIEPFNFISASRLDNPLASNLQDHLTDFLQKIKTPQKLRQFAIPMIASSFLQDAYPPDMHFFNPSEIFCSLYKDVCHRVCRTGVLAHERPSQMILPSRFIKLMEDEFVKQVDALSRIPNASSSAWHRQNAAAAKRDWLRMRSTKTCFMCMRARPQYKLPCGHILCHTCVRRHGKRTDKWTYHIYHCLLCDMETSGFTVEDKPPTATPRLLCIDGGGVRAIYALVVLLTLEELLGLNYPVYGHFDFIFGTSAGGIIALAFAAGLSVEECIALHERVAKQAFEMHFLWSYISFLMSIFTNGIYPTRNLDTALQEVYGRYKTILDHSSATAMGIKIGVVACTMKPEPFLFTNYNGLGDREDMKHEKYGILLGDALVWEIARSTCAAPWFFTPKEIEDVGKFQDGGLIHNNPEKLALKEIKKTSGDPSAKRSTLKVSLGSGKAPDQDPEMYGSNSWWEDLWFNRLFRALWSSIDGQESSYATHKTEVSNHKEELNGGSKRRRGEYFRFNFDFRGRAPRLDDSSKIPEMKIQAREAILLHSKQLNRLAHCIVAESFVFELESVPRKENGRYSCTGYILCRHRAGTLVFEEVLGRLTRSSAKFLLRGRTLPGSIQDRSSLASDGNFRKRVCVDVTSYEDLFSLHLQEKGSESYNISGSPFSINWLIEAEKLLRPFGRPDGVKRKRTESDEGWPKKRQRS